jgi:hypothetical protein
MVIAAGRVQFQFDASGKERACDVSNRVFVYCFATTPWAGDRKTDRRFVHGCYPPQQLGTNTAEILMTKTAKSRAGFIVTMDCLPVWTVPQAPEWTYEIKLDGYRLEAVKPKGN